MFDTADFPNFLSFRMQGYVLRATLALVVSYLPLLRTLSPKTQEQQDVSKHDPAGAVIVVC